MKNIRWLLIFVPVAILAEVLHGSALLVFVTSALAVIPLAGLMGEATEVLAEKTGPRLGGLLNATLGNAAELIITIFAIRAGLLELVKASIIARPGQLAAGVGDEHSGRWTQKRPAKV